MNRAPVFPNGARYLALLALMIFLAPLLMGVTAQRMYKDGSAQEQQGNLYPAALQYLDALDKNQKHKKSKEAIGRVAKGAYEEKLAIAHEYEDQERFANALSEYEALEDFLSRLRGVNAVNFTVVDVRQKMIEMRGAAAEKLYQRGEETFASGHLTHAIDFYRSAQTFKADYKDSTDKIATALYKLGDEELEAKRFRSAATRFVESLRTKDVPPNDAALRAASIHTALGRYFIQQGACRQAMKDLELADKLLGNQQLSEDLAQAEACSVVSTAILPYENPTNRSLAGMALGDTVADATASKVRGGASRFVKLMERAALDAVLAEKGLTAVGVSSAAGTNLEGVDYLVIGKLTQVQVEHPGDTPQLQSIVGQQRYSCTKTRNDGSTYTANCWRDIPVEYYYHSDRLVIRVSGSASVVDVKTGEQVGSCSLQAVAEDSVEWADTFRRASDQEPITLVERNRTGGLEIDDYDVLYLIDGNRNLKSEGDLAASVIEKLSQDSSDMILDAVDSPKSINDPVELQVIPL